MSDLVSVMNAERVLVAVRWRHLQDMDLGAILAILAEAGFRWISLDPNVLEHARKKRVDLKAFVWGLGDMFLPEHGDLAAAAGASFVVTRFALDEETVKLVCGEFPIIWTGTTVTELARGGACGARVMRLYPIVGMDALRWVRRLMQDFADWPLLLAGGIHFTNARRFLEMGIAAVELDDALFDPHVLASGRQAFQLHAREWTRHLQSFRGTAEAREAL